MTVAAPKPAQLPADAVKCHCGFVIYDGEVVRSRVLNPHKQLAKCRCKAWVKVPVGYSFSTGK
ncbi:hypothetical protein HMF8227_02372 [Saliniradius amylolyticus]|uniref:Uncharacterized protein n=1 Tax=Saliniradius amylolyticus TaxID=2183582 RepID=A0A2S2E590_9ALTE|nr:hypothetical protein [Saliniradius amylolyticus]AWL12824.1 hypothetical protein HMF8227_02372 [Saliniradius amylolyticus]